MTEDANAEKMDERQVVIFAIGNEEFGVNINEVREINFHAFKENESSVNK